MINRQAGAPALGARCPTREVLTRRLEDVEPAPSDEVPATRARYSRFAPPPQVSGASTLVETPGRAAPQAQRTIRPKQQVLNEGNEGPYQQSTPLSQRQLEDFSAEVLGSSSSVWSAEARNLPASTSDSSSSLDSVLAHIKGKGPNTIMATLSGLSKRGEFDTLLRLLQELNKPMLEVVCKRWHYSSFIEEVCLTMKAKPAVVFAKIAAPYVSKPAALFMAVLKACARCRDLDAGMTVVELARKSGVTVDVQMMTTLIKVCKAVGNVDKAYRVYLEMRAAQLRIDSHVYGALIATCAEAMKRDLTVVHERKDQYVLLERAFQYVADAEAAGVTLQAPVWNSLMVCAGRSGELNRAFEVLTMMQQRGIGASATTYGSLIESCVCARQPEKALRVFEVALHKGFESEVKLYTQALSACMLPFPGAWDRAQAIYSALQRCTSVRPDKKFFACFMAVAGRCGRMEVVFELLTEMAAEGIRPSSTSVSGIIHACLDQGNVALARRVYDLCAKQSVYPVPSQFNRMMDVYASEFRFGEVVSLLCDMVAAGRQPNLNTYRIIINACEVTDQAGLAFQVFALMHANKVHILQGKFAQTIYYMLIKACYNQTRYLWLSGGYPPQGPASASGAASSVNGGASTSGHHHASSSPSSSHHPHASPYSTGIPAQRKMEAEKVLAALGGHKLRRGAHQSNPFDGPPDTIDWASHALSAFHHMLGRGHRPSLELLDVLLNCMRAKMLPPDDSTVPGEAIGRGLLPKFDPDAPLVMDMRRLPPVVAEVYVLHILQTLDRRAKRKAAEAEAAAKKAALAGMDLDKAAGWPSYLERIMNRYTDHMTPEERSKLQRRNDDLDELEAVMAAAADGDGEAAAAARGLWAREDVAAMMAAGVPAAGMGVGMGDSWGSDSDVSDGEGVDPAGGQYRADFTTGLAVSATLQRMKVWMDMDYANGAITVFAVEVARPSVNGMGPGSGAVSAGGLFQQHQAQSQQAGSIFGPGAAGTAAGGAGKTRQAAAHSSPRGAQRPSSASASDSAADSPEQAVALESLAARLPSPSRDSSSNASLNRPGVRRVRKAGVTVTPHTNGTSANGVNGNGANGHTNGSYTNGHASNGHTNGASHGGASAHLSINVPSQHAVEVSVAPGMPVKINPQGIPSPAAAPAAAATAST
eukprot:XP_001691300.1 protein with PPR repeats [Chlamydomonas reinhardtii]